MHAHSACLLLRNPGQFSCLIAPSSYCFFLIKSKYLPQCFVLKCLHCVLSLKSQIKIWIQRLSDDLRKYISYYVLSILYCFLRCYHDRFHHLQSAMFKQFTVIYYRGLTWKNPSFYEEFHPAGKSSNTILYTVIQYEGVK